MSRIWKMPVAIPLGVTITNSEGMIVVKGPKGSLQQTVPAGVIVDIKDGSVEVSVSAPEHNNLWGLMRTLVSNMVEGVTNGYQKQLYVMGVGYAAKAQGKNLVLNLGYSHPINHALPEGITASVERDQKGNDILTLQGIDKQLLGEQAAMIRQYRAPEPYKGKGVRYLGEHIKMKAGKTAAAK